MHSHLGPTHQTIHFYLQEETQQVRMINWPVLRFLLLVFYLVPARRSRPSLTLGAPRYTLRAPPGLAARRLSALHLCHSLQLRLPQLRLELACFRLHRSPLSPTLAPRPRRPSAGLLAPALVEAMCDRCSQGHRQQHRLRHLLPLPLLMAPGRCSRAHRQPPRHQAWRRTTLALSRRARLRCSRQALNIAVTRPSVGVGWIMKLQQLGL